MFITPFKGRPLTLAGTSGTSFRPPWPWAIRRFGEGPEDWAAEGYPAYYGMDFATELHYPCDDICNFLTGSTWTLSGSVSGITIDIDGGDPLSAYTVSGATSDTLTAKLGQAAYYGLDDAGLITATTTDGEAWDSLNNVFELSPLHLTGSLPASQFPTDRIVALRATQYVEGTSANAAPDDVHSFEITYAADVYSPEIGPNELGDLVWRMKIVGYVEVLSSSTLASDTDYGLYFTDNDYAAYSKSIRSHATGYDLDLSVTRA